MKSLRFLDRRAVYALSSLGLLLGMVLPGVFPVLASAQGQLTSRSITMSSSASGATGVSYQLQFTAQTAVSSGGGVYIDFCDDSPLVGLSCGTATNDAHTSSAALGAVKYNGSAAASAGTLTHPATTNIKWVAGTGFSTGDVINITITGMANPAAAGTFYARVSTYANSTDIGTYASASSPGTIADQGGVALSATSAVGITAYVAESMTFCVSHTAPTANCAGADSPSMTIGEISGSQKILNSNNLSTGTDYAQLSTNASSGAVVNLHSSTTACGGLVRAYGSTNCDISAQAVSDGSTTIAAGTPKFGLTVGSAATASGATSPSGTLAATNGYDATHYYINYVSGDATGVTSTYGSALFNSGSAPVNNQNIPLTFGASISNSTPAGIYGATLNLIATGTF